MVLANEPAYGRPVTCPESPAQFVQPGTDSLDPFSPDAARCSYVAPATAAPARLRGTVQSPGPDAAPTLGPGVEGVRVELYAPGVTTTNAADATPIGRAETDASGGFFLTAPVEAAGEYLLIVRDEAGGPPLAARFVEASAGDQTVPTLIVGAARAASGTTVNEGSAPRESSERSESSESRASATSPESR
ncbi:MAG: hypothetical protein ACPHRO_08705 [Nannocystaceae bacterium]